jgi:hypothetical protein
VSGPSLTVDVAVRNPTHAPAVVTTLVVGTSRVEQRILEPSPEDPEVYRTSWTLVPRGSAVGSEDAVRLAGRGHLTVTSATAASVGQVPSERQLRTQYAYRVRDGAVQVLDPPRRSVVTPVGTGTVQHDVGRLSQLSVNVTP